MRTEDERRMASMVAIAMGVIFSAAASWYFVMIGINLGELGMYPIIQLPRFVWGVWGVAWGAACGYFTALVLVKKLKRGGKHDITHGGNSS